MTTVDNAVALMNDSLLLQKVQAVQVYVARQVVIEPTSTPNHAARLKMAQTAIYNPAQLAAQLTNIIACDTDVCGTYSSAVNIPDSILIDKMTALWTYVALMIYP